MTKIENMTIVEIKDAVDNCGVYVGAKFSHALKEEIAKKTITDGYIDFLESYIKKSKKGSKLLDFENIYNGCFGEYHKFCCGKRYLQKIQSEGRGKDIYFKPKKKPKVFESLWDVFNFWS